MLIDSEPLHLSTFMTTCACYGFAFDAADNGLWIGKSFTDMWNGIPELRTFGLTIDELNAEICDHCIAEVQGGMARAPAPDMVAGLAGRGVTQGCASSSPRRIVEANVAAVGVAEGKPSPDLYLLAAKQLGLAPADCLAVEDTESGLAAAKSAGLTAIVWPNDFNAVMDFSAADHVVDDLAVFKGDLVAGA